MDIQLLSFILAIVVGLVCFGLVKHTADEFDRWYDEQGTLANLRVPSAVSGLISLVIAFIFIR